MDNSQWADVNDFVHGRLRQYAGQMPQDVNIVLKKSGLVLKPNYISSGKVAYQVWGMPYAKTYSEWIAKVNSNYKYDFRLDEEYRFVCCHTMFPGTEYEVTIVATLADKDILDFEKSFRMEEGRSLAICNRGEKTKISVNNTEMELDFIENNNASGHIVLQNADRSKYIAMYAEKYNHGFKLCHHHRGHVFLSSARANAQCMAGNHSGERSGGHCVCDIVFLL